MVKDSFRIRGSAEGKQSDILGFLGCDKLPCAGPLLKATQARRHTSGMCVSLFEARSRYRILGWFEWKTKGKPNGRHPILGPVTHFDTHWLKESCLGQAYLRGIAFVGLGQSSLAAPNSRTDSLERGAGMAR